MVCVAVKGKPIIGVIHQPFNQWSETKTSWAWIKHGMSTNLKSLLLSDKKVRNIRGEFRIPILWVEEMKYDHSKLPTDFLRTK